MSKKADKNQQNWEEIKSKYAIDENLTIPEIVKVLVNAGDNLQGEICKCADTYKIDMLHEVNEAYPSLELERRTWIELVTLRQTKKYDDITEKKELSIKKKINASAFKLGLQRLYLNHELGDDNFMVPIPDINEIEVGISNDAENPDIFISILERAADERFTLTELYKEMRNLREAFAYKTGRKPVDYKILVDTQHYIRGGFPSETSPPRYWGTFKKYRHLIELYNEYEYSFGETWNKKFGLDLELGNKHFTWNDHTDSADKWVSLDVFMLHEDEYARREDYYKAKNIGRGYVFVQFENVFVVINPGTNELVDEIPMIDLDLTSKVTNFTMYLEDGFTSRIESDSAQRLLEKIN